VTRRNSRRARSLRPSARTSANAKLDLDFPRHEGSVLRWTPPVAGAASMRKCGGPSLFSNPTVSSDPRQHPAHGPDPRKPRRRSQTAVEESGPANQVSGASDPRRRQSFHEILHSRQRPPRASGKSRVTVQQHPPEIPMQMPAADSTHTKIVSGATAAALRENPKPNEPTPSKVLRTRVVEAPARSTGRRSCR